jgi:hypothetical protein
MGRQHAKAFNAISSFSLTGAFNRTRTKSESFANDFSIPFIADSIEELYEKTKADVVVVSVSELETAKVCEKIFQFPWKVLCEKPVGYNLEDSKHILDLAKKHKANVYVALNRRHFSSTRNLLAALNPMADQRIIRIFDQEDPRAAAKAGRPSIVVENWMFANSIHLIDLFPLFGRGAIQSIDPIVKFDPQNPCFVAAKINYSSGDVGLYEALWNRPGPWSISVSEGEHLWTMQPIEHLAHQVYGSRLSESMALSEKDQLFKPGFYQQACEVLELLENRHHNLPTLADSYSSMELVSRIYC